MTSKRLLILVLLFPFLFNNCSSDSGIDGNSNATPLNFGSEVSKNFTGQILDENNNPVSNVAITAKKSNNHRFRIQKSKKNMTTTRIIRNGKRNIH